MFCSILQCEIVNPSKEPRDSISLVLSNQQILSKSRDQFRGSASRCVQICNRSQLITVSNKVLLSESSV